MKTTRVTETGRAVILVSYTNTLTVGSKFPTFRTAETINNTPHTIPEKGMHLAEYS